MVECRREDALVAMVAQGGRRALEPDPLDEGEEGLVRDRSEDPVEVKGREGGNPGELSEGEVFGEVASDVVDDSVNPLLVLETVRVHGCDLPLSQPVFDCSSDYATWGVLLREPRRRRRLRAGRSKMVLDSRRERRGR